MPRAAREIREEFLGFFESKGHSRVKSASLVPESDPTLMFVNAGMVPFKGVFTGEETRPYSRAASSQKCMRVSGKHNDLEEVGRSPKHHTFFEMLGNFSFGDYFKQDAIEFGWELLTQRIGLSPERLAISVFEDDDEAADLWHQGIGVPLDKIYRLGESENFWSMGDTGPCGPCSEIHVDYGVNVACTAAVCDPSCDCGRWIEIWNLVFMQFERSADGTMAPLPKPSIDTGMGLERASVILQDVEATYDTDVFLPLIERAADIAGVTPGADPDQTVSLQVVADHARSVAFLIGDGVLPSNGGRGYVLRRILRRASRHGVLLGIEEPFLHKVADKVIDEMSDAYPELSERRAYITDRIARDEERFLETLSKGLALLEDEIAKLRSDGTSELSGEVAFKLYDTYGFPLDLTDDILRGHDMRVDQPGFESSMQEQRDRARQAWKGSGDTKIAEVYGRVASDVSSSFRGYEGLELESPIVAMLRGAEPADVARAGEEVEIVVEETPFYAESGGQVGDVGTIEGPNGRLTVTDTQKPADGLIVHRGKVEEGELGQGDVVRLVVDEAKRRATVRNHSGTHLLHAALRNVLGDQAMQKGSLVGPDRLRFDFTHDAPLTVDELDRIEDLTNEWIETNASGETREMAYRDAIDAGAIAIFEEKYGDDVRVVSFGDVSTELCGGTHAAATGEIGLLKIVSESGIAAGVRRIEALTGQGALQYIREQERAAQEAARLLKVPLAEVPGRVERLLDEKKNADREIEKLQMRQRGEAAGDLVSDARDIDGGRALAVRSDDTDAKVMRTMADELRSKLGSGVVLIIGEAKGKVLVAIGVTKDLTDRFKAGDLIREVAQEVGGGGGGRPDFAQAGGKEPGKIDDAIARFYALVEGA